MSGLKRRFRPYFTAWAVVMWVALQGELSVGNVLAGLIVGLGVSLLLPLPAIPSGNICIHPGPLMVLLWYWLLGFIHGAFAVAWISLRPAAPPTTAIITVPMRVESELILAFGTTLYNLQPGGTVTDIDVGNREWTVHLLKAESQSEIDQARAAVAMLEKRLIAAFERGAQ